MLEKVYTDTNEKMSQVNEAMKKKLLTIRTGKVSISAVDSIKIDYYGTMTQLSQVASIVTTDATTIVISPWEKNLITDISRAISEANIGVNPNDDAECVKLFFPPMTSEQRLKNVKLAKSISDDFKVSARNVRKESNDIIKKMLKNKDITEDESKQALSNIQDITDKTMVNIDNILKNKEQEILKI
jgi:ribosome recycling factor